MLPISFNSTVRIFLRRSLFTFGLLSVFGFFFFTEIKALPPPESYTPPPEPELAKPQYTDDLVNLKENDVTGDDQGNKFALALFAGPPGSQWEAFPSDGVTSAWQNPAAEPGKADWELALVETASNLEKQTVQKEAEQYIFRCLCLLSLI